MKRVTASEFQKQIVMQCKLSNPKTLMVYGDPGIGKTAVVRDTAKLVGRKYLTVSLGRLEAYDIKGVPNNTGEYVEWKPPVFWREVIESKGEIIVHFDEFTLATEDVQGAILDVVLTKTIDNLKLPEKTLFILSGNMGGDDGTNARAITSALTGGRGYVFEMIPPRVEEWIAYQKPIQYIKDFLKAEPRALYVGPNLKEPFEPWTCPRSWSQLDDTVKELINLGDIDLKSETAVDIILDLASAILSPSTVIAFREFLKDWLIDPVKLYQLDNTAWNKFAKVSPQKKSFALTEVVSHIEKLIKEGAKVNDIVKDLQAFLDKLVKVQVEPETLSVFFTKLSIVNYRILAPLKYGDELLRDVLDKLVMKKYEK